MKPLRRKVEQKPPSMKWRSSSRTFIPPWASKLAQNNPPIPAPTTMARPPGLITLAGMEFTVKPVGFVHASRHEVVDDYWGGELATIELAMDVPEDSLDGIDTFSHAEILFVFDKLDAGISAGARHPRGNPGWPRVGIFAQRAKARPNRIGATIVRIVGRQGRTITVSGLDALDGTPVVDIKPVMAEFLPREPVRQPEWSHALMRSYWRKEDR